jgi:hypothetical protein
LLLLTVLMITPACRDDDGLSRELGASCDDHADCASRCLSPAIWPLGFCTSDCTASASCPGAAACVDTLDDGDVCLFTCEAAADCAFLGTGWDCVSIPSLAGGAAQVCAPPAQAVAGADAGPDAAIVDAGGVD